MVQIERLGDFTDKDLSDLSGLGAALNGSDPVHINPDNLRIICDNPDFYVQIIARSDDQSIVGSATLSLVMGGISAGKVAYLEDFAVSTKIQGQGIGGKIWDEIINWCKQKNVSSLEFTSKPSRVEAHAFYKKRGAGIRDTSAFRLKIQL